MAEFEGFKFWTEMPNAEVRWPGQDESPFVELHLVLPIHYTKIQ